MSHAIKIEKIYDENATANECVDGRIYEGVVGWRWVIYVDNQLAECDHIFPLKRNAVRWVEKNYDNFYYVPNFKKVT